MPRKWPKEIAKRQKKIAYYYHRALILLPIISMVKKNIQLQAQFVFFVVVFCFCFCFCFCLFAISRVAPSAYGGSQARGRIGAVATGLRQSHSNAGSEPRLQPTPQLTATPDR